MRIDGLATVNYKLIMINDFAQSRKKRPNFTVQSGDLNWKGYAQSKDVALRKAFNSFRKGSLSTLTRFRRTGETYFYIDTETAIQLIAAAGKK